MKANNNPFFMQVYQVIEGLKIEAMLYTKRLFLRQIFHLSPELFVYLRRSYDRMIDLTGIPGYAYSQIDVFLE
jgi:hypothetical protein